jgi:hypothetical protein
MNNWQTKAMMNGAGDGVGCSVISDGGHPALAENPIPGCTEGKCRDGGDENREIADTGKSHVHAPGIWDARNNSRPST